MSLKLAWAGPWNTRSAIAAFGRDVTAALARRGHSVEILRTEIGPFLETPALPCDFPVHSMAGMDPHAIVRTYDVVIANLGDHFGYHGALASHLPLLGALAILHDAFMANFCFGWAHHYPDIEAALRAMVSATYGAGAMPPGETYWLELEAMMRRRPMVELFAGDAVGAIVHAGHYRERVTRACPGPVWQLPLSYYDLDVRPPRPHGDSLEIVSIGNVNTNRQIGEVIKAIGGSPLLRARCRYRIIGAIDPAVQQTIHAQMAQSGVTAVEFTGWVSDDTLRALMADVDVICCLRHPVLEGGSGSMIAALLSGRPVLVSDQGVYGELPLGVALKCQPGAEAADVGRHLEALLADRAELLAQGLRGQAYARLVHTPEHYAELLDVALHAVHVEAPARRTARRFGALLGSFGLAEDDPAMASVLSTMTGMLGTPRRS